MKILELLKEIEKINTIRVRISSLEPNLFSEDIIDLVTNSKIIVPHFHIPLQSGCDKVLKLMKRRYLTKNYKTLITKLKSKNPSICIGADVIVGFPGETESDFKETLRFIKSLPISYLHVFSYSERENTIAKKLEKSVSISDRKKRSKSLRNLSDKKKNAFYTENLNKTRPALIESGNNTDYLNGYTDNYIKIEVPYKNELKNKIVNIKIHSLISNGKAKAEII